MKRRDFLKKAGLGAAAAAAGIAGCEQKEPESAAKLEAPVVVTKKTYQWKMVTSWPPKLPVLQEGCERLARRIAEVTDGQIKIDVFAGGELIPALESFQAVSDGTAEVGSGASYYWAGKTLASQWFAAVPFGMNAQAMAAWFHGGDGLKLWEEVYAPFNLIPRPGGSTGAQMGGWFNKKINAIEDFKGLRMRIPGLGGKVVVKAGGIGVLLPGSDIFSSLQRGLIDASEWVGPLHDLQMGFHQVAKYYYYPGWHEPGTYLEYFFNKKTYESLPTHLQQLIDAVCMENEHWVLSQFEARNGAALQELIYKHKVELIRFPEDVLKGLRKLAQEVIEEEAAKDALAKKVHNSFTNFQKIVGTWGRISEKAYYDIVQPQFALRG